MSTSATRDRLLALLAPVVRGQGLDLEDIALQAAGRRWVLRVVVDRDGGVSLDDVAQVSREVSARLDANDVMGSRPYVLEVSSPGVDRPLTEPRHWRRAASRLVRVPLPDGGEITGRIVRADESAVVLDIDGQERAYSYAEIGPGRVQVEFSRRGDGGNPVDDSPELTEGSEQEEEAKEPWTST